MKSTRSFCLDIDLAFDCSPLNSNHYSVDLSDVSFTKKNFMHLDGSGQTINTGEFKRRGGRRDYSIRRSVFLFGIPLFPDASRMCLLIPQIGNK